MKQNKTKVLSLRVTQEEYDTLELLSMMSDISITILLRGLLTIFFILPYKKQEKIAKSVDEIIWSNSKFENIKN